MARTDADLTVTLSVIDRLIDTEPSNRFDPVMTRSQSVRMLKSSLRRDLEWLLNTRRNPDVRVENYPETAKSLHYYGLPDFTVMSFSNTKDRTRLLRMLEQVIKNFEPRLASVKVIPVETSDETNTKRLLRFQIEGLLKMDPAPEHVSFDTVLQLTSGEYTVRGEPSA
jgi:type VI secretion system protein ImpF